MSVFTTNGQSADHLYVGAAFAELSAHESNSTLPRLSRFDACMAEAEHRITVRVAEAVARIRHSAGPSPERGLPGALQA